MKRMHIHVSVDNLQASTAFYSQLFGAVPSVLKPDYAKWMLDDPRVNFAISQRGATAGLDHLGIQVESDDELADIKKRLDAAGMVTLSEADTVCCYAKSDKHWVVDPSGIAWEAYHTLDSAPTFHDLPESGDQPACCAPPAQKIEFRSRKAGCA
ncbi:MAG TPA: ArsI/CadI family heavy metal resistance metalloenzyme [Methylophilaceae bacterium]|nr:ArsI/CadI family heavy metal resistance metalloenzyme [Methylophilaceae bacterium]